MILYARKSAEVDRFAAADPFGGRLSS